MKLHRPANDHTPPKQPPFFNIPPVTKILCGVMIAIFIVQEFILSPDVKALLMFHLGFISENMTRFDPQHIWTLITPLTYIFLHASLMHIAMNILMLLAFGAGLERWLGGRTLLILFFASGIGAIFIHFIFNIYSTSLVIGASGGTSGLFAAGLVMLRNSGANIGNGRYGLYPVIGVFLGISVVFGLFGGLNGENIAWVVHIGGFATGLLLMKLMKRL